MDDKKTLDCSNEVKWSDTSPGIPVDNVWKEQKSERSLPKRSGRE